MPKYVKCPRCELNYILDGKQEYCDVCIAEMKGNKLQFADFEDEELEAELESEVMELCPVCGINNIRYGEAMCESCKKQSEYEQDDDVDTEEDEEWKNYLNDDSEDLSLDEEELAEELAEVQEEDEEYEDYEEESDFFDDDVESLDDYDDDDYDDDDDDEDDDDLF